MAMLDAGLLIPPPPEKERQGSKDAAADDSLPSSQILRDYYEHHPDRRKSMDEKENDDDDDEENQEHQETIGIGCILTSHCRRRRGTSFILDSGAPVHATGTGLFLLAASASLHEDSLLVYRARNGAKLPVAGVGTIACANFRIPNVSYVPGLRSGSYTIISVQQLAQSGYLVMFCGGCCYVKDHSDGSLVAKGRMHHDDGLYHLDYLRIPDDGVVKSARVEQDHA
uniref:Uncharacterized protein n=3 Tax=Oryza TaxID=4527 RepID=A0A679BAW6_9ORYZ|nr:hypothetical protein [Oryza barthii]BBF89475.1 hypothetical protein [Oryza glaberrima]BBF89487.1 hypothetical protein [Oryza glaberrima]